MEKPEARTDFQKYIRRVNFVFGVALGSFVFTFSGLLGIFAISSAVRLQSLSYGAAGVLAVGTVVVLGWFGRSAYARLTEKEQILCGLFGIAPLVGLLLFPVFAQVKISRGPRTSAFGYVRQASKAMVLYREDHSERLPNTKWMDAVSPYFKDPSVMMLGRQLQSGDPSGYYMAMNSLVGGDRASATENPDQVAIVFTSSSKHRNAMDPLASLRSEGFRSNRNFIGYLDGHAVWVPTKCYLGESKFNGQYNGPVRKPID